MLRNKLCCFGGGAGDDMATNDHQQTESATLRRLSTGEQQQQRDGQQVAVQAKPVQLDVQSKPVELDVQPKPVEDAEYWQQKNEQIANGSCASCAALKLKLKEKDAQIARVVSEINSEMKISQGDHGQSKESIAVDYLNFFSHEWAKLDDKSSQDKMDAKVELCKTFQDVYDFVKSEILQTLQGAIPLIFQLREDGSEQKPMNDLSRAYARLLVSQKLTSRDKCPQNWEKNFLDKYGEEQKPSIKKAVELSWKLATAVPPYIATKNDPNLDDDIHEQVAGGEDIPEGGAMRYLRPTLYASFDRHVTHKGLVTN